MPTRVAAINHAPILGTLECYFAFKCIDDYYLKFAYYLFLTMNLIPISFELMELVAKSCLLSINPLSNYFGYSALKCYFHPECSNVLASSENLEYD